VETAQTIQMRAWLSGTLAIDLSSVPAELLPALAYVRQELTLRARGRPGEDARTVPFWIEEPGWLYLPRGWLLTPLGQYLSRAMQFFERRSSGQPLPSGTRVQGIAWGAHPFPSGQPRFIEDAVRAVQANGHGGLLKAPTRSGKTFCSLEVACRLGLSTLVLVDTSLILEQWRKAIEGAPGLPGIGVSCGVLQAERFEARATFAVAMVQTLGRRAFPEWVRRAFGTIIVDECQGAAADTIFGALMRFEPRYVLGLSATPDRPDGLGASIPWMIGPEVARLERRLEADVFYLGLRLNKRVTVEKSRAMHDEAGNEIGEASYQGRLSFTRYGQFNAVAAEKMLCADDERVGVIASNTVSLMSQGHRTIVAVGQREHAAKLYRALELLGKRPGMLLGGVEDPAREMRADVMVATAKFIGKGADIQPCATALVVAAPFGDMRQLGGRVLNPQAPRRAAILDCVDLERSCVRQALKRRSYFAAREHDFTCGYCRALVRQGCRCADAIFTGDHA
jgi:hypothetical protein